MMDRKRKVGFVTSAVLALVTMFSLLGGVEKAGATCPLHCWHLVASYDGGSTDNTLYSVDAISQNNVWAVGDYSDATNTYTLAEKWDGSSWQNGHSVNKSSSNGLQGVASARGDTNIWAVGWYNDGYSHIQQTLIEKYSGSPASWSIVSSPNQGSNYDESLTAVAGDSATDYWAVGRYYNGSHEQTLILHWDGTSWKIVSSPNHTSYDNQLYSVTVIDSTHAWAVGEYLDIGSVSHPLLLKWDGTSWTDQSGFLPSSRFASTLASVSFPSNTTGLAVGGGVGFEYHGPPGSYWDTHTIAGGGNQYSGVDYLATGSAWAVGKVAGSSVYNSTTAYWDGSSWTTIAPVGSGAVGGEQFNSVSGLSQSDTWAVGWSYDAKYYTKTYIEHYY